VSVCFVDEEQPFEVVLGVLAQVPEAQVVVRVRGADGGGHGRGSSQPGDYRLLLTVSDRWTWPALGSRQMRTQDLFFHRRTGQTVSCRHGG
jgi:hypothetical protein